jgi:hypothetical protein
MAAPALRDTRLRRASLKLDTLGETKLSTGTARMVGLIWDPLIRRGEIHDVRHRIAALEGPITELEADYEALTAT